jgi:hypothetical protein
MAREKKKKNIYLLTKYIKSVLCGVAVRLSYILDAWCIKVKKALSAFCMSQQTPAGQGLLIVEES